MALSVGVRQSPTFHHWMAQQSKIIRHYSQNIDGIEELVPKLCEKTILIHGSIKTAKCNNCSRIFNHDPKWAWDWINGTPSVCVYCENYIPGRSLRIRKGHLLPNVILYNQTKSESELNVLIDSITKDSVLKPLVLVVGTSLATEVNDARSMLKDFKDAGSVTVYVNPNPIKSNLLDYSCCLESRKLASLLGFRTRNTRIHKITRQARQEVVAVPSGVRFSTRLSQSQFDVVPSGLKPLGENMNYAVRIITTRIEPKSSSLTPEDLAKAKARRKLQYQKTKAKEIANTLSKKLRFQKLNASKAQKRRNIPE